MINQLWSYNYGNGQGDNTSSWDMLLDEKVALWRVPGQNWDAYYTVAANSAQASQPNVYKLEFDDGTISLFRDGQMITTKTGANLSDYNFDNSYISWNNARMTMAQTPMQIKELI